MIPKTKLTPEKRKDLALCLYLDKTYGNTKPTDEEILKALSVTAEMIDKEDTDEI